MVTLLFRTSPMSPLQPGLQSSTKRCRLRPRRGPILQSDRQVPNSPLATASEASSDNDSDPDFRINIQSPVRTSKGRQRLSKIHQRQHVSQRRSSSGISKQKRKRLNETTEESGDSNMRKGKVETLILLAEQKLIPNSPQSVSHVSSITTFSDIEMSCLCTQLLDWYTINHRSFPWRALPRHRPNSTPLPVPELAEPSSPGAPYAVWISEVMSQQTRIDVVVSYYKKWMQQLPTIDHVANASLDVIYELWAGLGYYRRAKFLHEGAKQIVEKHGGILPQELNTLLSIKGIGKYTAGAIASIAFQQPVPCVDGNVDRVFSRLRPGIGAEANSAARMKSVWKLAGSCVSGVQVPGDFNQALMELGATVCKPRLPDCSRCPVRSLCGAYTEATLSEIENVTEFVVRYPAKAAVPRCKVRPQAVVALVAWRKMPDTSVRLMLVKRKTSGLLEGLWEAPNQVVGPYFENEDVEHCVRKVRDRICHVIHSTLKDGSQHSSVCAENLELVGDVTHIFSHIRQTLRVMTVQVVGHGAALDVGKANEDDHFRWVLPEEIEFCAVSTQMKKVFSRALTNIDVVVSSKRENKMN